MGKVDLNLRVDAAVLEQLAASGVDPAALAEAALTQAAKDHSDIAKAAWTAENAEAIKAHRERIEKYGVFGDDLRTW